MSNAPKTVKCRSCGAAIIWAITARGVRMPLDAEPNPVKGNQVIELDAPEGIDGPQTWRTRQADTLLDANQTRYMPHHATCPQGRGWRR
jgi:hypothetical protein